MVGSVVCHECGGAAAKYRCPRCSLRSCSLQCVNSHKQKSGCTGKRDRTAFVRIADFNDNQLVSDYNLLEETLGMADTARRTRQKHTRSSHVHPALKPLLSAAHSRNIRLSCMPFGMSRRARNTTYYDKQKKCIFWRLEWVFDSTEVCLVDEKLDENASLQTVLAKQLSSCSETAAVQEQLRLFRDQPLEQLKLLYKKEPCEQGKEVYYELDSKKPLRDVLASKRVIEYPVLRVVLPSNMSRYTIQQEEPVHTPPAVVAEPQDEQQPVEGKLFQEEEIQEDEDDVNVFDFLEDLPGEASLWE